MPVARTFARAGRFEFKARAERDLLACNLYSLPAPAGRPSRPSFCRYSTAVFETQSPTKRPAKCISADPSNPNCQIMGNFTLQLNRVNSKPAAPSMDQGCPTLPGCQHGWQCPDQPPEC